MGKFRPGRPNRHETAQTNALIREHFERQAGRISFNQLKDIGLDSRAVARRRKKGELVLDSYRAAGWGNVPPRSETKTREMPEGVYRSPGASMHSDGQYWSGILSAPRAGYLDHVSTLQLVGLEPFDGGPVHVVVEGNGWVGPQGVKTHRTRTLPDRDHMVFRGFPSVTVPRALLSAASDVEAQRLHDLLDTAVRADWYEGEAVVETVERFQTVPGYDPLTKAIAALDATSGTFRSIFERRTMRLVERSRRLPPAEVNVLAAGYRPDFRFIGTRAIIECDGRDYHRSPAQIIADDERQSILEALGYRFLRLRWHHVVYEEERTLARIEAFVLDNLAPPVPGR